MKNQKKYDELADDKTIEKTIGALMENNINAVVVENGNEATSRVFQLIPPGASIMSMTSTTLDTLGLTKELSESSAYSSVRKAISEQDEETRQLERRQLGAAPEWAVGSVHAITEDGIICVASNTGSQLPAYAYGALNVLWVVGAQKIVRNLDEAMDRIYNHCLPLEDARAQKAYGMGSGVNKILIIKKEVAPARLSVIFVKEKLGF
jgi:L-lactate utilization protein LutC